MATRKQTQKEIIPPALPEKKRNRLGKILKDIATIAMVVWEFRKLISKK